MTDRKRLFVALFREDVPVFDPFVRRNGHLDEPRDLLHAVGRVAPKEPKEVAPAAELGPREPTVFPEEVLEERMDAVHFAQRVFVIGQAFGLRGRMDFALQP